MLEPLLVPQTKGDYMKFRKVSSYLIKDKLVSDYAKGFYKIETKLPVVLNQIDMQMTRSKYGFFVFC